MKNTCPNNVDFIPPINNECPKSVGGIKSVKFYPKSGEVYDEDDNYLGKGVMDNGILVITPFDIIR